MKIRVTREYIIHTPAGDTAEYEELVQALTNVDPDLVFDIMNNEDLRREVKAELIHANLADRMLEEWQDSKGAKWSDAIELTDGDSEITI
jgi:hypothetical protein